MREPDDDPASCPVCGAAMWWEDCWYCHGDGWDEDDDDDPDDVTCPECRGEGGYLECSALPHTDARMAAHQSPPP